MLDVNIVFNREHSWVFCNIRLKTVVSELI